MPEYDNPLDLTRWQMALKAARELGKEIFTANDIVKKIHESRPDVPATSIRTYVIAMAPEHDSYHHYPTHHPCFEYLGNGKYKLMREYRLPLPAASTSSKETILNTSNVDNTKEVFLQKYGSIIAAWTKENQQVLIDGRKDYRWRDKTPTESLEIRNDLSRQIVLSRIRNNGGVDIDTLDRIMAWGFPKNPKFAERDPNRCLEMTRQAFNLLDSGKLSNAICKLMSFPLIISRASKIIGLFDQNYFAIYDSRVGLALATLKDDDRIIKIPGRRPQPGKIFPSDNCTSEQWGKNYQKLLWVLEVIRDVLNEEGYPFNLADVEMALFMMGKVLGRDNVGNFSLPIPKTELKEGIQLSIENAERLIIDAETLYNNKRHVSASYLSVVALEEEGRAIILLRKLLDNADITEKYWRKTLEDHQSKIIAIQEVIAKYRKISVLKESVQSMFIGKAEPSQLKRIDPANLAKFILESKNRLIYVDWDFVTRKTQINHKWESPSADVTIEGFSLTDDRTSYPVVDENTRREKAEGLLYEAKVGLESARIYIKENLSKFP